MASAANAVPVDETMMGDHYSWQDVYASYGCSTSLDGTSDDDG